jgi:hypothetical protein
MAAAYRCFSRIANAYIHGFRIANAEEQASSEKYVRPSDILASRIAKP